MKDLLAYLKTIDNGQDDLAVRRIINIPKRGIGAASINKVALYAQEQEISFYDALCVAEQVPGLGKAAAKIRPFVLFIQSMKAKAKLLSVADLLQEVIETTGYVRELEAEGTDEEMCIRDRNSTVENALIPAVSIFGVFLTSVITPGYLYGVAAAILSVLELNFAFTFPFFHFNFSIPENMASAVIIILMALITCGFTTKIKYNKILEAERRCV